MGTMENEGMGFSIGDWRLNYCKLTPITRRVYPYPALHLLISAPYRRRGIAIRTRFLQAAYDKGSPENNRNESR